MSSIFYSKGRSEEAKEGGAEGEAVQEAVGKGEVAWERAEVW
jgi:hypothetical protein